ncbi:MAG: hypothetical protein ACU843_11215 [Gammaproteobacteria bacterium]
MDLSRTYKGQKTNWPVELTCLLLGATLTWPQLSTGEGETHNDKNPSNSANRLTQVPDDRTMKVRLLWWLETVREGGYPIIARNSATVACYTLELLREEQRPAEKLKTDNPILIREGLRRIRS